MTPVEVVGYCLLMAWRVCGYPLPVETLPILVTRYDPALCWQGEPINCDDHPHLLADGYEWTPADYGHVAACIPEWLGRTVSFGEYELKCRDTGGLIRVAYSEYWQQWVVHVDIMSNEQLTCNYCLYPQWEIGG